MKIFDTDNIEVESTNRSPQSGNNCDIFEPSVYTPDGSKFRADYIKRITQIIEAELDSELIGEEAPEGEAPSAELELTKNQTVNGLINHIKFILKYLRGPRGFNGSVDNIVVLSEVEYNRLTVKDPNKFYFTYEGTENPGYVENNILYVNDVVDGTIMLTSAQIENNILVI